MRGRPAQRVSGSEGEGLVVRVPGLGYHVAQRVSVGAPGQPVFLAPSLAHTIARAAKFAGLVYPPHSVPSC